MILQITSDKVDVTEAMKTMAEDKINKLAPFFANLPEDAVFFRVVMNPVPVEEFETKMDAVINGKEYFGQTKGFTLEHSVVGAVEDILEQLKKHQSQNKNWEEQREMKRLDIENVLNDDQVE